MEVYGELARRIRQGEWAPGTKIPREADVADEFQVSRSVAREALLLLEEDGLIETRHGVGRYVIERLSEAGLERLRPVELLLADRKEDVVVRRHRFSAPKATDYTSRALAVAEGTPLLMVESVVEAGEERIGLAMEWIPAAFPPLYDDAEAFLSDLRADPTSSLLAHLIARCAPEIVDSHCTVTVTNAGSGRGRRLRVTASAPMLLLSTVVTHRRGPVLLSKHLLRPDAAHLTIQQRL